MYNFRIQNDLFQSDFTKKNVSLDQSNQNDEFGQNRFWVSYLMARSEIHCHTMYKWSLLPPQK